MTDFQWKPVMDKGDWVPFVAQTVQMAQPDWDDFQKWVDSMPKSPDVGVVVPMKDRQWVGKDKQRAANPDWRK